MDDRTKEAVEKFIGELLHVTVCSAMEGEFPPNHLLADSFVEAVKAIVVENSAPCE